MLVRRAVGCLAALPLAQRRVMVLRANLAHGDVRSRPRVAEMLRLSPRRVARLERRALAELRQRRADGCLSWGAASRVSVFASATPMGLAALQDLGLAATSPATGGTPGGRGAVAGVNATGDSPGDSRGGAGLPFGLPGDIDDGLALWLVLLIPMLLVLIMNLLPTLLAGLHRRRRDRYYRYYR